MEMKVKVKHACFRGLGMSLMLMITGMMTTGMLQATVLWSNGSPTTAGLCEGQCGAAPVPLTIFDNFTAASNGWTATGFDYSDFFVNTSTAQYTGTKWSIWSGDPLQGGKVVASGTATLGAGANLSITSCSGPNNCLAQITVTGLSVQLNPGTTYYLGTSSIEFGGAVTNRALAAGNGLPGYEQSNGSTTGAVGSMWTPGAGDQTVAGADTAFDIIGTTPEPGTISLMTLAIAGLFLVKNRRSGQKATT